MVDLPPEALSAMSKEQVVELLRLALRGMEEANRQSSALVSVAEQLAKNNAVLQQRLAELEKNT